MKDVFIAIDKEDGEPLAWGHSLDDVIKKLNDWCGVDKGHATTLGFIKVAEDYCVIPYLGSIKYHNYGTPNLVEPWDTEFSIFKLEL
jgi:hypothetical protein